MKTCPICENNAVDENASVCPICKFNDFRPIIVSDEEYGYWIKTVVEPSCIKWEFEQKEMRLKEELSRKEKEINTLKEQLKKQTDLPAQTPPEPVPLSLSPPKIGSIIKFGGYDWRVLDVQNDKALLLTEEVIDSKAYHSTGGNITWAECELRSELNGTFYDSLGQDKSRIAEEKVINNDNLWFGTKGGKDITDKIFLLSIEEADRYFGDSGDYLNKRRKEYKNGKFVASVDGWALSNNYDSERIAYNASDTASWWWLRSPGYISNRAAYVYSDGNVIVNGILIGSVSVVGGVRPALWLKFDANTLHIETQQKFTINTAPKSDDSANTAPPLQQTQNQSNQKQDQQQQLAFSEEGEKMSAAQEALINTIKNHLKRRAGFEAMRKLIKLYPTATSTKRILLYVAEKKVGHTNGEEALKKLVKLFPKDKDTLEILVFVARNQAGNVHGDRALNDLATLFPNERETLEALRFVANNKSGYNSGKEATKLLIKLNL
ncbi:MAG: DUF6273 domain-containing protein [Oscillospiraceae bacterium]|nr:DUF6273 domain-containing protein [Oscillospiraceae bacterium]